MTNFFWWSGVAAWALLSALGVIFSAAWLIEWAIKYFGFYRTVMQFAWDRARAASKAKVSSLTAGKRETP